MTLSLVLTGCGGGGGNSDDENAEGEPSAEPTATATEASVPAWLSEIDLAEFAVDDDAKGPAPAVEGALEGGTVRVIAQTDYQHLDPARIYVNTEQNVSSLITRQLTTFRQGTAGEVTLVGDLATNTGETEDDGKTWTFHLRDGIRYEDGSEIKAKDIKYGIERAFKYTEGPTYLQEWLTGEADFKKVYKGPDGGKHLDAITVPDDKTIVFKLKKAQPDVPFAVSMPISAPVKESKDTKAKYDQQPFATGPYKIAEHKIDKSLKLVRNDEWDPATDPARHQYPDAYEFEFGPDRLIQTDRMIAAKGDDQSTVSESVIATERIEKVRGDEDLMDRTVEGFTLFVWRWDINQKRIKDLEVRKALLTAMPKEQLRQLEGGSSAGEFATTVLSPSVPGFEYYDLYKVKPEGDPAAAKKILEDADKLDTQINFAFPNTETRQKQSVVMKSALEEAGFKVVLKQIPSKTYYEELGEVDNSYDLYLAGWGADWPSGATVFPMTLDGTRIADQFPNYSHFDDSDINSAIEDALGETDLEKAADLWGELDRKAMEKIPSVPYLYDKDFQLYGPKVGGAKLDSVLGLLRYDGLYVTDAK